MAKGQGRRGLKFNLIVIVPGIFNHLTHLHIFIAILLIYHIYHTMEYKLLIAIQYVE